MAKNKATVVEKGKRGRRRTIQVVGYNRLTEEEKKRRTKIIENNLLLACWVAKRMHRKDVPFEDQVQYGIEGLIIAADRYDEKRSKFSTYATDWIRGTIARSILDYEYLIRVPHSKVEKIRRAEKTHHRNTTVFGEKSERAVGESLADFHKWSLNASAFGDADGDEIINLVTSPASSPEENVTAKKGKEALCSFLEKELHPREWYILRKRFGLGTNIPATLEAIGEDLGFVKERVRQIEGEALVKARSVLEGKGISGVAEVF